MENDLRELLESLEHIRDFSIPDWDRLPNIPLYMEQVVFYVNDALKDFSFDQKKKLTSFMVNNYVKAGIIHEPEKKKYKVEQLGYLMAITILKSTLSMGELSLILDWQGKSDDNGEIQYKRFQKMIEDIAPSTTEEAMGKIAAIGESENSEDRLLVFATELAIKAEIERMISSMLLKLLSIREEKEEVLTLNPSKKERSLEDKKSEKESERIGRAKAEATKKAKEKKTSDKRESKKKGK